MNRLLPVLLLVVFVLVGCGDDPQVRTRLSARVAQVKAAALAQNRLDTETALAALHREIAEAVADGELDADSAGSIMTAADRVAEDVRTIPAPGSGPVTVTVNPSEPRSEDKKSRSGDG
ncbi:hypothetical protein E1202_20570 [Saccharopolyspora karakumensis]|uniref:Uncharacterized protein n=1 Tax=Saccharopolyspora karakumensis TaxID=2530386 RepID=A0A4R5BGW7_9PSEU|nr:hypothetical protein [Saccharopolyspora karakumensis]TDD85681.1 hypothetical protein E1202_20570 [Saccharopolyspora karakumensis]